MTDSINYIKQAAKMGCGTTKVENKEVIVYRSDSKETVNENKSKCKKRTAKYEKKRDEFIHK